MRTRRALVTSLLGLVASVLTIERASELHAQPAPSQLIVDNRTRGAVDLYRHDGQNWYFVMTVKPGYRQPISYVRQGEQVRGWLQSIGQERFWTVNLRYDSNCGCERDVWLVQK